jgi:predicted metal-binding membrane protein
MTGVAAHVRDSDLSRRMTHDRAGERTFLGASAVLFVASAAVTIVWCGSMATMDGDMPMPGGWTMSMAWMRMPGQTWVDAGATFLGMWIVMMVAMMMPSLVPMLRRYRRAVGSGAPGLGRLTAVVSLGYFAVWTMVGIAAYPLGVALAAIEMRQPALARAVPLAVGLVVVAAGVHQLGAWKARHLACCREMPGPGRTLAADAGTAWRHGVRLGLHCAQCCAGLMAILLVVGVMDLGAMAIVAVALTVERGCGERVARGIGIVAIGAGLLVVARAAGLG